MRAYILPLLFALWVAPLTLMAQDGWRSQVPSGATPGSGVSAPIRGTTTYSPQSTAYAPNPTTGSVSPISAAASQQPLAHVAQVTPGVDVLPRTANQQWRTYDISPFTHRFAREERPQQEIIDWILRETGTDLWFGEPLGILSADYDKLHVYHEPGVQALVHNIVDRFVDPNSRTHVLTFYLVQVGNPSWRAEAIQKNQLVPVEVRSEGVQGWLMSKEVAGRLYGDLSRRNDFRLLQGQNLYLESGQTKVLTRTQPRNYVSGLGYDANNNYGYLYRQINEGFSLEMSALKDRDRVHMEAVVRCNINQIERMLDVNVNVPTVTGSVQRVDIQVPQLVTWRLHERFKWPVDHVLVLSCGVVATPGGQQNNGLLGPGLLPGLGGQDNRGEALLFLEVKATNELNALPGAAAGQIPTAARPGVNNYNRY